MNRLSGLANDIRLLAVRDFRFSEFGDKLKEVLPLLVQTDTQARKLSTGERRAIATLVNIGSLLKKIQPDASRIDRDLGQAVDSLAIMLTGD